MEIHGTSSEHCYNNLSNIVPYVKFCPFESKQHLGHYEIHNDITFEDIIEEITSKTLTFSIEKRCYNFDSPTDINGLNSNMFGFFSAMHLTHTEKIENENEDSFENTDSEEDTLGYKNQLKKLTSFKEEVEKTVVDAAGTLTGSITSVSNSISRTMSSALKLNSVMKMA